ncbi:MAG TPA: LysM peptidoglycan-binding domain-containing protein [Candidatus Acidoferrales bacterium]|jgi:LysM repeat protein|nr:LysM peptidoglycan-binding domain-containing protein [Candidatus Acidoferrales bacterium]
MNNPNPFVPKGSLLELQSKRRSRLKLGVFCVLAVGIAGLAAMLIQGCKREESENQPDTSQSQPPVDTNNYAATDTNNPSSMEASNSPEATPPGAPGGMAATPPPPTPPPTPVAPPPPQPTENEYVVVKGDTLGKIAKANGVTLKALEDANSGISPTRLHIGQKLVIPAGASTTGATTAAETASGVSTSGEEVYTVKSGDTLTRIAHHFGLTVKAIMTENNLTTTHIKVGQKLNIPAKPEAAPTDVNTPPTTATPAAPAPEPMPSAPAPSTPPPAPANGTPQ